MATTFPVAQPRLKRVDNELIYSASLRSKHHAQEYWGASPVLQLLDAVHALLTELEQQRLVRGEDVPDWPALAAVYRAMHETSQYCEKQLEAAAWLAMVNSDWPAVKRQMQREQEEYAAELAAQKAYHQELKARKESDGQLDPAS